MVYATITWEGEMPTKQRIFSYRREAYRLTTDIVWPIDLFFLRLCPIFRQNITYGTRQLRHGSNKLHRQCGQ